MRPATSAFGFEAIIVASSIAARAKHNIFARDEAQLGHPCHAFLDVILRR
jgi:hypothetical protein